MKRLKVITAVALIFVLGFLAGSLGTKMYMKKKFMRFADANPQQRLNIIMERLTEDLDLTDTQQAQIRPVLEESLEKFAKRRKEFLPHVHGPLSRNIKLIREFLTDEQQKKLDTILAKRFGRLPGHHFRNSPPGIPPDEYIEQIATKLNLSGEQINKVRPVLENAYKQQQELILEARELRKESRKMFREGMDSIRNATVEQLKPYFTEEQIEEFLELHNFSTEQDQRER